jgi:hypothetical protein
LNLDNLMCRTFHIFTWTTLCPEMCRMSPIESGQPDVWRCTGHLTYLHGQPDVQRWAGRLLLNLDNLEICRMSHFESGHATWCLEMCSQNMSHICDIGSGQPDVWRCWDMYALHTGTTWYLDMYSVDMRVVLLRPPMST